MKYILFTLLLLSSLLSFSQRYEGSGGMANIKTENGDTYIFYMSRKDSVSFYCSVYPPTLESWKVDNSLGSDSLYLVGKRGQNGSPSFRILVKGEISTSDLQIISKDTITSIGFYWLGGKYLEPKLKYKSQCELFDMMNHMMSVPYVRPISTSAVYDTHSILALTPENNQTPGDYLIKAGNLRSASTLVLLATAIFGAVLVSDESYSEDPVAANVVMISGSILGLGLHFGANGAEVKAGRLLNR